MAVAKPGEVAVHVEDAGVLVIDDGGNRVVIYAPVDGDDRQSLARRDTVSS